MIEFNPDEYIISPAQKYNAVVGLIAPLLDRLRMGVYSEERDGDLLAVLEEIERTLR